MEPPEPDPAVVDVGTGGPDDVSRSLSGAPIDFDRLDLTESDLQLTTALAEWTSSQCSLPTVSCACMTADSTQNAFELPA